MNVLVAQLEFYWDAHLWPRLEGLTDEEYHWEPVPDCWGVRPEPSSGPLSGPSASSPASSGPSASSAGGHGRLVIEGAGLRTPEPAPFTTLAWRLLHVAVGCFHIRVSTFFGDGGVPADATMFDPRHEPAELPANAEDALTFLEGGYHRWHDGIAALTDAELARPLGPRGGPFAEDSMAALVAHVNRELMHHGGEICLLRDLYAHRHHLRP